MTSYLLTAALVGPAAHAGIILISSEPGRKGQAGQTAATRWLAAMTLWPNKMVQSTRRPDAFRNAYLERLLHTEFALLLDGTLAFVVSKMSKTPPQLGLLLEGSLAGAPPSHAADFKGARVNLGGQATWTRGEEEAGVSSVTRVNETDGSGRSTNHALEVTIGLANGSEKRVLLSGKFLAERGLSFRETTRYLNDPRLSVAIEIDELGWGADEAVDLRFHPDCLSLVERRIEAASTLPEVTGRARAIVVPFLHEANWTELHNEAEITAVARKQAEQSFGHATETRLEISIAEPGQTARTCRLPASVANRHAIGFTELIRLLRNPLVFAAFRVDDGSLDVEDFAFHPDCELDLLG